MSNTEIRVDFSKVDSFYDFCRQMADKLGFECGCHSRDAFFDRMRDINVGYHKNVRLASGETLHIGVFAFRSFSKRNPRLARDIEKYFEALNAEALAEGHGAPLYELVTIPDLKAEF
jgi:hypothetical protein